LVDVFKLLNPPDPLPAAELELPAPPGKVGKNPLPVISPPLKTVPNDVVPAPPAPLQFIPAGVTAVGIKTVAPPLPACPAYATANPRTSKIDPPQIDAAVPPAPPATPLAPPPAGLAAELDCNNIFIAVVLGSIEIYEVPPAPPLLLVEPPIPGAPPAPTCKNNVSGICTAE
jgi:hypothetical protein